MYRREVPNIGRQRTTSFSPWATTLTVTTVTRRSVCQLHAMRNPFLAGSSAAQRGHQAEADFAELFQNQDRQDAIRSSTRISRHVRSEGKSRVRKIARSGIQDYRHRSLGHPSTCDDIGSRLLPILITLTSARLAESRMQPRRQSASADLGQEHRTTTAINAGTLRSTWEQRHGEPAINRQFLFGNAAALPFQPDTVSNARMLYCIEWTIAAARARTPACSCSD